MEVRIIADRHITVTSAQEPRVVVTNELSPQLTFWGVAWSEQLSLPELFKSWINKIELEFSDERTRISSDKMISNLDEGAVQMLATASYQWLEEVTPSKDQDALVEIGLIMRHQGSILIAALGHISIYGWKEGELFPILALADYADKNLKLPSRGVGLSSNCDFVFGSVPEKDLNSIVFCRGISRLPIKSQSLEEVIANTTQENFTQNFWICHVELS